MAKTSKSGSKRTNFALPLSDEERKIFREVAQAKHAPLTVVIRQLLFREYDQIKRKVA